MRVVWRGAPLPTREQCVRAIAEIQRLMTRIADERANPVVDIEYDILASQLRYWDGWLRIVEDRQR